MAISQTMCTPFKLTLLNFVAGDSYKIALYTANANLDQSTAAYTTTGEVSGTGYIAGGESLTVIAPASSGAVAYMSFQDVTWTGAAFTARGALIYNTSRGDLAVAVLDFGSDKTCASTFTITFPTNTSSSAIARLA